MPTTVSRGAPQWSPQYFSYVAVAGASLLGVAWPAAAPVVLGPVLLVGLVGLGLAHGACDQLVLPALAPARRPARHMLLFLLSYLSLAAVAGLGWWYWPAGAVATFFLLTVWHWGSADAPAQPGRRAQWLVHSVLRGTLLFAVPTHWWLAETLASINGLLTFTGTAPLLSGQFAALAAWLWPLTLAGHLLLWASYARQRAFGRAATDLGEALLLALLFMVLPPLLALGIYFVFWHSLQHALRLTRLLGYAAPVRPGPAWVWLGHELLFFIKRALPLLLVSLVALAVLYMLLPKRPAGRDAWLSIALILAAVLTVPHALLVSLIMDAAKWRRPGGKFQLNQQAQE